MNAPPTTTVLYAGLRGPCWVLLAVLLSGCVGPRSGMPVVDPDAVAAAERTITERRLQLQATDSDRIFAVAFPLAAVVAQEAPDFRTRPALGIRLHDIAAFTKSEQEVARALWRVGERPAIAFVVEGSPGDLAGLRARDTLLAVEGREVDAGEGASRRASRTIAAALEANGRVKLLIGRDDQQFEIDVAGVRIVDMPVQIRASRHVNAWAYGRRVGINAGMLRFVENEHELAFVVAHEMAHNALRHQRAVVWNYLLGTAGDGLLALLGVITPNLGGVAAASAWSVGFEYEADLFALRWMDQAGFEPEQAIDLWPRLAARSRSVPRAIPVIRTHPPSAERIVFMQAVVAELNKASSAVGNEDTP